MQNKNNETYLIGIDPSLTNTGILVLNNELKIIYKKLIKTNPNEIIEKRINEIIDNIKSIFALLKSNNIYINIEGLSFNSKGCSIAELSALHYSIRLYLYDNNIKYDITPPTILKKFCTGKGNCKKELILLNVYKKFNEEFDDNNLADAYTLARMCYEKYTEINKNL